MGSPHESADVRLSYLILQTKCFCLYSLADIYREWPSPWPLDLIIFARQNLDEYKKLRDMTAPAYLAFKVFKS
jgi:hypothetical protein